MPREPRSSLRLDSSDWTGGIKFFSDLRQNAIVQVIKTKVKERDGERELERRERRWAVVRNSCCARLPQLHFCSR